MFADSLILRETCAKNGNVSHNHGIFFLYRDTFANAGLRGVLTEAEVVAAGSIDGVITGHPFNRSMWAQKLPVEGLQRLGRQACKLIQEDNAAAIKVATQLKMNL